jgi:hypothetical protein
MSKTTTTVILTNGVPTEIPTENLDNFKRLNASKIREVILENQSYDDIIDEIDNEDSVVEEITDEVVEPNAVRKNELMASDKDVVRMLADEISVKEGIPKVGHNAKQETLADFIIKNQK